MTRKIYIEAEVEIPIIVRCKAKLMFRADDNANIERALKRAAEGTTYDKADLELAEVEEILEVGHRHEEEDWELALGDVLDHGGFKVLKSEVTDSK